MDALCRRGRGRPAESRILQKHDQVPGTGYCREACGYFRIRKSSSGLLLLEAAGVSKTQDGFAEETTTRRSRSAVGVAANSRRPAVSLRVSAECPKADVSRSRDVAGGRRVRMSSPAGPRSWRKQLRRPGRTDSGGGWKAACPVVLLSSRHRDTRRRRGNLSRTRTSPGEFAASDDPPRDMLRASPGHLRRGAWTGGRIQPGRVAHHAQKSQAPGKFALPRMI